MPATACCSLGKSPPGPWPGHYSFTFYLLLLFIGYMNTVYCIFNVAGHWAQ